MINFFVFAISFIIVYLITPTIRYIGLKFYVVDRKNHRKIHTKVITKLGGVALYCGFLGGLIIAFFFDMGFLKMHILPIGGLVVCITLMLLLGIYDDFQGSGPFNKLIVQTVIALLLIKFGFSLERIYIPGLLDIRTGIFSIPLSILWLVGITNAVNLVDGMDGLAAGVVGIISSFIFVLGLIRADNFVIFVSLSLAGACFAFLKYNFYPAKIFMGDTGSLFLGLNVATLGLYRHPSGSHNIYFIPVLAALLFPVSDIVLAVIRRLRYRRHIFSSDSSHIHHRLLKKGYSQINVTVGLYMVTFILGIIALIIFAKLGICNE